MLAGCQCCPPVRECAAPQTVIEDSKMVCPPARTTVTVIRRQAVACPALPPVGEIAVMRCNKTKMVFVNIKPEDRLYNVDTRGFERPWPWGPYGTGDYVY